MAIPIKIWIDLIEQSLQEMSDRNYQKKQWGPEGPFYGSFNEFIALFYDDADFEGFIKTIKKHKPSSTFLLAAMELDKNFSEFIDKTTISERYDDYEKLIDSPEWRTLSSDAQHLLKLLRQEKVHLIASIRD